MTRVCVLPVSVYPYGRPCYDTNDATFRGTFRDITRTLRGHYAEITQGHTHITRTLRDLTRTLRGHYAGFTQDNTHITRTLRNITRTLRGHYAGVTQDNTHISHIPMGMAMLMNPHVSAQLLAYQCVPSFIPIYVEYVARKSHANRRKVVCAARTSQAVAELGVRGNPHGSQRGDPRGGARHPSARHRGWLAATCTVHRPRRH